MTMDRSGQAIMVTDDLLCELSQCGGDGTHCNYNLAQVADLLGVPRRRVRAWFTAGLIQPASEVQGVPLFDFQQVANAKTLCTLADAGVSTALMRHGLERLRAWMGDDGEPLDQLAILERNGRLLVRLEAGLVEPSGQMYFDFGEEHAVLGVQPVSAEEWFDLGCQYEEEGASDEAIHADRQALLTGGPDADICFNLANVLYATGRKEEASERYRQAVELDQHHAEAWNNLGVVLGDLRQNDEAEVALGNAIQLGSVDAHFNLGRLLDRQGRTAEARQHWRSLVRGQPRGVWSAYAQRRLAD
jgi:tetratricopeptide (TPR) repeat protein